MTILSSIYEAQQDVQCEDTMLNVEPCVLNMLNTQVELKPQNIAIRDTKTSIDYASFWTLIHQNARRIKHVTKSDDPCIGLFCDPSVEMITGAWSILASNHAYLPLAPEYPEERIRYMVDDSAIQVIITQEHLKSQLKSIVPKHITILTQSELEEIDDGHVSQEIKFSPKLDNLAYVIYTSGSSGKPKGVMVTYANISHQIAFLKRQFGFDQGDCILQKTPASFDAAQWEILAPAFGCQVVVAPKDCYRDPDSMIETILNYDVSVLQCVPTLLQALVDHPLFSDCLSLEHVFSGGEILTRNLAKEFFERMPNAELTNLYGPTECTINSSFFTLSRASVSDYPDAISIGKPVANTEYHVLRDDGQPTEIGEVGELYISGFQVARGYYRRSDITAEKFVVNHLCDLPGHKVMYKTGDLVKQDMQGNAHFISRADNQIKLRGYRVELDEIRLAIENHQWVKTAAMVVKNDPRTGHQNLIACVELDEKQAALMDQGNHDTHHQSKSNKFQVKAQLSSPGLRDITDCETGNVTALPGRDASMVHREKAFGRKTYRFFDGDVSISKDMLLNMLERQPLPPKFLGRAEQLSIEAFGDLLRNFGQFNSPERLLPKYAYASPGALYATQMYFEIKGLFGLEAGIYYYHPAEHCLVKTAPLSESSSPCLNVHFIGRFDAIESVYKNNIQEVLEMETGHMLGLFDELLPEYGLCLLQDKSVTRDTLPEWYDGEIRDFYLGNYRFDTYQLANQPFSPQYLIQTHENRVEGLCSGLYTYKDGELHWLTDKTLQKRDVVAINQKVFERSSFGVGLVCSNEDKENHYIQLGRAFHRLQSNSLLIGLMSSGYSSKTNNDLPSAIKMRAILDEFGLSMDSFYFGIGGPISESQYLSEGMNEDLVHMQGPTEILKEDLSLLLPQYMIPNKVLVLNKLPQMANGKVDYHTLNQLDELNAMNTQHALVPLTTDTEKKIGEIWCRVMKWESVSAEDDFFESGGNSLTAVAMNNMINSAFAIHMPLQVLFHTPTISGLAQWVDDNLWEHSSCSRLIPLNQNTNSPVFCWPGLGGYPLNLKLLASKLYDDRAFYGIQALGINAGEQPLTSIRDMALEDIKHIKSIQPKGPYTLWGYSFGARVAFETAAQLEEMGDTVEALYLLAPGSPNAQVEREQVHEHEASFENPVFVAILFSVFAHKIEGRLMERCLELCNTEHKFVGFICERFPMLQSDLVKRIIKIVKLTYEFSYRFEELENRCITAPITIIKAHGDHYSFIENAPHFSKGVPKSIELDADHYQVLKEAGVGEIEQKMKNQDNNYAGKYDNA
ncbi:amino acid adenylation domain-containing protein [Vibrio sp. OCN044]|uniref:Amino acid adenylation domain-containing protein n=2 Tax=Vibrio tetraodonis TaxID=2231647 RepID=A0A6L8M2H7_9VIBR|nr:amino acid adenylation domain-containing protein [Vibrio tetraodonis subsp. pristinus]